VESFSLRSIYPEKIWTTVDLSMHHKRGIKSPFESNEVPIDREYPHAHPVNF